MLLSVPAYASDFAGDGTGGDGASRLDAQLVPITRALGEAFFSVLLEVLVFLVAFGLVSSMLRAGKKV